MQDRFTPVAIAMLIAGTGAAASARDLPARDMPKCAINDEVVMVNTKMNYYATHRSSSTTVTHHDQANAEDATNLASMKSGMKPMCKSTADAMGVRMVHGPAAKSSR
jgi:hypothetical protein